MRWRDAEEESALVLSAHVCMNVRAPSHGAASNLALAVFVGGEGERNLRETKRKGKKRVKGRKSRRRRGRRRRRRRRGGRRGRRRRRRARRRRGGKKKVIGE